jgi:hypothetical protein
MNDEIRKSTPAQIAERCALAASCALCGGNFKVYCAAFTKMIRLTGELLTGLLPIKMSGSTGPDQSFGPVHSEVARQSFSEQISKLG